MKSRKLVVEMLEMRVVLDAGVAGAAGGEIDEDLGGRIYEPMIVAGDPNSTPPDSEAERVTTDFPGVGSLFMRRGRFSGFICTGTLISNQHVLTAGHCLDSNDDGSVDFKTGSVSYFVNGETSSTHEFQASALTIHGDYSGFANPVVNDDIAVVTLSEPVPSSIATPYELYTDSVASGDVLEMVGFGRSGNGIDGYTTDASLTVKRLGYNAADDFGVDDEGSGAFEVWEADFDHPSAPVGYQIGGPSLGNNLEANLGGGDSGGPSFVNGKLAAINTYGFGDGSIASPKFGTGLGGMLVQPYLTWIQGVMDGTTGGGNGGGGGGNNGGGNGRGNRNDKAVGEITHLTQVPTPLQADLATNSLREQLRSLHDSVAQPENLQLENVLPTRIVTGGTERAATALATDIVYGTGKRDALDEFFTQLDFSEVDLLTSKGMGVEFF